MVVASTFAMASVGGAEKEKNEICTGNDWAGAEGQKKSITVYPLHGRLFWRNLSSTQRVVPCCVAVTNVFRD